MEILNKGYLYENFRLFHLRDQVAIDVETHFHDFDKFVMVCSGSVDYLVEGVSYHLLPGDILFIRHHDIHRPTIFAEEPYERFVLWISTDYLDRFKTDTTDLSECFSFCSINHVCHFHPNSDQLRRLSAYLLLLESSISSDEFGKDLLVESSFVQLLVLLNRIVRAGSVAIPKFHDPVIDNVLVYINSHICEDLSVDVLASKCFISRYYFMRRFKQVTGYTVHYYVQQKRLALAARKIESGSSIILAAQESGFTDYSSFLKSFHKAFGLSPSSYKHKDSHLFSQYSE